MPHTTIAARIAALGSTMSPYPPSFDDSAWLYFFSLASLMCISMFAAVTGGWMIRDIWADRYIEHPKSPVFLFRLMVAIISTTAFLRCLPEVAFMTCYGEVTGYWMGRILAAKRLADVLALPTVVVWEAILVVIYPFVILSLKAQRHFGMGTVDPFSVWPRLIRPLAIFASILVIASLMAAAKGAMGHHG